WFPRRRSAVAARWALDVLHDARPVRRLRGRPRRPVPLGLVEPGRRRLRPGGAGQGADRPGADRRTGSAPPGAGGRCPGPCGWLRRPAGRGRGAERALVPGHDPTGAGLPGDLRVGAPPAALLRLLRPRAGLLLLRPDPARGDAARNIADRAVRALAAGR